LAASISGIKQRFEAFAKEGNFHAALEVCDRTNLQKMVQRELVQALD